MPRACCRGGAECLPGETVGVLVFEVSRGQGCDHSRARDVHCGQGCPGQEGAHSRVLGAGKGAGVPGRWEGQIGGWEGAGSETGEGIPGKLPWGSWAPGLQTTRARHLLKGFLCPEVKSRLQVEGCEQEEDDREEPGRGQVPGQGRWHERRRPPGVTMDPRSRQHSLPRWFPS